MTRRYAFRVVNVFAEERLAGNPLAVIENAEGLSDAEMQRIALQFNLSETTFILPATDADAHVRIFTPRCRSPVIRRSVPQTRSERSGAAAIRSRSG